MIINSIIIKSSNDKIIILLNIIITDDWKYVLWFYVKCDE